MTKAPFSDDQIASLNGFQDFAMMHPFTCGTEGCGGLLVATRDGWICENCDYTQDWAHDFMADGSWRTSELDAFYRDLKKVFEKEKDGL